MRLAAAATLACGSFPLRFLDGDAAVSPSGSETTSVVVETGVDPVTSRFSGARSTN
jgi:hypothetical protein